MKKFTKAQEDRLTELFEMFWECLPKGAGAKVGVGAAREAWFKKFRKVKEENWSELYNTIKEPMIAQEAYRKKVMREYPDERDRKNAGIFLPSRPHPSTWINQERWRDEARQIQPKVVTIAKTSCKVIDCDKQGTHVVEGGSLCDWHWTKAYNRDHLKLLADTLKKMGLDRQKGESMESWSNRCRGHIRNTEVGKALSA